MNRGKPNPQRSLGASSSDKVSALLGIILWTCKVLLRSCPRQGNYWGITDAGSPSASASATKIR
jgi:hypothetical protein